VLEVLYHRATVWWGSDFTRRRGGQNDEVFVCLSVGAFVTFFDDGYSAYDFASKLLEYRNAFDTAR